ncbi:cysteine desulfurase [Candidatus Gottesmanbacteria bacterium]|nr:cysteine desulfurase [Candidatus Gottesmanbacteria bacterium]MBI3443708.1 cysteine desulfurase [Candidatus Woesebacteria bacterium]
MNFKLNFPIFNIHPDLVYLDSTATSLKPQPVIDALNDYYNKYSANVFRGLYKISQKATFEYENARKKIAQFLNAKKEREVVFVRSATEAINLVAYAWGRQNIKAGDEIVTTIMEHHSNFVPWQQLAKNVGAEFIVWDIEEEGKLKVKNEKLKVTIKNSKLFAVTHVSNVLGTINPVKELISQIRQINPDIKVLVDGAQAMPHMKVDVEDLGCDFYVFSGHKMLGPTGIGVLWAKEELLEEMQPFNYGGEMIKTVYVDRTEFKSPPHKFEAGTPHIAGAIGLGAAVDYLEVIGMDRIRNHESGIMEYAIRGLRGIKGIRMYGPMKIEERGGVISFNLYTKSGKLIHGHDVAQILDEDNICIRAGHHCAMPLHTKLGVAGSARASFYIYNSKEDVDKLVMGIEKILHIFNRG